MSRPMDFKEFAAVVNHISKNNSPFVGRSDVPTVKYIDPHFDMRSNTVFSITFRLMGGGEQVFYCQNECRDLKESLFERCMAYLKGEQ